MQRVPPPADDYPERLAAVIQAVLDHGCEAGAAAIEPMAYARREMTKRPSLSRLAQGRVYRRDHFQCRYCGGKLIPTAIMQLVAGMYPAAFPYHRNWKGGQTHPAVIARSPIVDHVEPGSTGGAWLDVDNMVTACWPCNSRKADFTLEQLDWSLRSPDDTGWKGLTNFYGELWVAAREPNPKYHQDWMRALEVTPPNPLAYTDGR